MKLQDAARGTWGLSMLEVTIGVAILALAGASVIGLFATGASGLQRQLQFNAALELSQQVMAACRNTVTNPNGTTFLLAGISQKTPLVINTATASGLKLQQSASLPSAPDGFVYAVTFDKPSAGPTVANSDQLLVAPVDAALQTELINDSIRVTVEVRFGPLQANRVHRSTLLVNTHGY